MGLPRLRFGLLLAVLCLSITPAQAGEGEVTVLPNMKKPTSGLNLVVDSQWVAAPGYRPIQLYVETRNGRPSKQERRLTVEIETHGNWRQTRKVSGELVLPQGQTSAQGYLLLPQSTQFWRASVVTYENGRQLKDLSETWIQTARNNSGFALGSPTMLVIDTDAPTLMERAAANRKLQNIRGNGVKLPAGTYKLPDIRGMTQLNLNINYSGTTSRGMDDAQLIDIVFNAPYLEMLPPEQLPTEWIGFTGVDLIMLSLTDMLTIRRQHERLAEALKQWVAAGGNLIVYDLGHDYGRLPELESMLELNSPSSQGPLARWQVGGPEEDRGKHVPGQRVSLANGTAAVLGKYASQEWQAIKKHWETHPDSKQKKSAAELDALNEQYEAATLQPGWWPMRYLPYGYGKIVVLPEAQALPGSYEKWQWVDQTVKPFDTWNARVGVDLQSGDSTFLAYAIPDVGLPPVNTFRLLITLFVIVIGPVNYLLLKRRKRLFLLLVTVPLGAAIVTGSLFGYALIKDGLRVRSRVYSMTHLDQRAGLASNWSRQTYFASLPPSRGLTYPDTAAAFQVFNSGSNRNVSRQAGTQSLEWSNNQQHLRRGYMGSRTTTEFLVASSVPLGETTLQFKRQAAGKPPQVTNRLGVPVTMLMVAGNEGSLYWAEDIEVDASVVPQSRADAQAMATFRRVTLKHRPSFPETYQQSWSWLGGRRSWNNTAVLSSTGILGYSRLESLFNTKASGMDLKPGEFMAIVPTSPFVPMAVNINQEEESFHLIRGRYVPE